LSISRAKGASKPPLIFKIVFLFNLVFFQKDVKKFLRLIILQPSLELILNVSGINDLQKLFRKFGMFNFIIKKSFNNIYIHVLPAIWEVNSSKLSAITVKLLKPFFNKS